MVRHERDSHKTAKRPAVHADAVLVDIGQRLQELDALHLVLHLHLTKLAERGLLEVASTILRATVVEDEEQIALLSHIGLPTTRGVVPAGIDVMSVRTTIDIDNGGILLLRVEVDGLHHAIIQVGHAIGSLHRATRILRHTIVLPGILGGEQHALPYFTFLICLARE